MIPIYYIYNKDYNNIIISEHRTQIKDLIKSYHRIKDYNQNTDQGFNKIIILDQGL